MELDKMLNIFLIAMLAYVGGYGMYTVIRLRRERVLFKNRFLYPANCKPEDCLDEPGFINYVLPRLTLVALVSLVLCIAMALISFVLPAGTLPWWIELIVIPVLGVGVLVWYMFVQSRAFKIFW